jgi:hypothetical protein
MKKAVLCFLLILGISSIAFSLEESWLSLGTGFGNYLERDEKLGDFYMGSFGANISGYGFWNQKNIGIFINYGFLFPSVHNMQNNFNPLTTQMDFLFGVGFRHNFNERLKLHYGIGLSYLFSSFMDRTDINNKFLDNRFGLGIGGDIGIKYDITDVIYFDFGLTFAYNFVNYSASRSTTDNWTNTKHEFSGWVNNSSMIGIKPYIAIGFNYYQEKGKWGKPE